MKKTATQGGFESRNAEAARRAVTGWLGEPGSPERGRVRQVIEAWRPGAKRAVAPIDAPLTGATAVAVARLLLSSGGGHAIRLADGALIPPLVVHFLPEDQPAIVAIAEEVSALAARCAVELAQDRPIDPDDLNNVVVIGQLLLCEVDWALSGAAIAAEVQVIGLVGAKTLEGRALTDHSDHLSHDLEREAVEWRRSLRQAAGGQHIRAPYPKGVARPRDPTDQAARATAKLDESAARQITQKDLKFYRDSRRNGIDRLQIARKSRWDLARLEAVEADLRGSGLLT